MAHCCQGKQQRIKQKVRVGGRHSGNAHDQTRGQPRRGRDDKRRKTSTTFGPISAESGRCRRELPRFWRTSACIPTIRATLVPARESNTVAQTPMLEATEGPPEDMGSPQHMASPEASGSPELMGSPNPRGSPEPMGSLETMRSPQLMRAAPIQGFGRFGVVFEVNLGPMRGQSGVDQGSIRRQSGLHVGSTWGPLGVHLGRSGLWIWARSGFDLGSMRRRPRVHLGSLRGRSGVNEFGFSARLALDRAVGSPARAMRR